MRKKLFIIFVSITIIILALVVAWLILKPKDNPIIELDEMTIRQMQMKLQDEQFEKIHAKKQETNNQKQPYQNIPQKFKNYTVVGKIEIPKIKLETYILDHTTDKTLNVSVTKFYGPTINTIGNFCITGHNYNKPTMFGKIHKLEINDEIKLIDIYDQDITYKIYDIYTINPKDLTCLEQNTDGQREVTLITCTKTGAKRLVIKACEVRRIKIK